MECKECFFCVSCCQNFVLIETLWNVKKEIKELDENKVVGINRNIMECKVIIPSRGTGAL